MIRLYWADSPLISWSGSPIDGMIKTARENALRN
jgi:hypothetical protein